MCIWLNYIKFYFLHNQDTLKYGNLYTSSVCMCVHVCLDTNQMHLNIEPFRIATLGGSIYGIVIVQPFLKPSASFYKPYKKINSITSY